MLVVGIAALFVLSFVLGSGGSIKRDRKNVVRCIHRAYSSTEYADAVVARGLAVKVPCGPLAASEPRSGHPTFADRFTGSISSCLLRRAVPSPFGCTPQKQVMRAACRWLQLF
jgi:hypothetical protein